MELDDLKQTLARLDAQLEEQATLGAFAFRRAARDSLGDGLRPFYRAQTWLIVWGVISVLVGVGAWRSAQPMGGLFISGLVMHGLGAAMIAFGAVMKTLTARIDASGPVLATQKRLAGLRRLYIVAGIVLGLSWFVLWVPAMIALFGVLFAIDITVADPALWLWMCAGGTAAILAVGAIYQWARASGKTGLAHAFENAFTGRHLRLAQAELDQIARFERN